MKPRALLFSVWAVAVWATAAFAQEAGRGENAQSYALGSRKIEVTVVAGAHRIEWQGTDINGVPDVIYSPGGDGFIGAGVGIGMTKRFSAQIAVSLTRYESDMYWRPEEPHDPYLAKANLVTFTGGARWDIRNARYRVRPYVGGGLVAARFADIERGPAEFCSPAFVPGSCLQMAPELFTGTRFSWYLDVGVGLFINRRWAVQGGLKTFPMLGSGTAPTIPQDYPTGKDHFWHYEAYGGLVLRVH